MREQTNNNASTETDEITLKELILKLQEFYRELIKNWKLVIFITIPFIAFFLYKAYTTPPSYAADLTFMVNEDEAGGGAMTSILSQFGFGGGGGGSHNLEKILELSKTRRIIQLSLFDTSSINGKTDILANHIIDIYNLHEDWEDSKMLKEFKFIPGKIELSNRVEKTALKKLQSIINGSAEVKGIYFTSVDEDTGIMTLKATSLSESLTIDWLNLTYKHLSQYYTDKSIEKQKFTYDLVKGKVDSVKIALNNTESRLARFKDANRGLYTNTASLEEGRLMRELQVLTIIYGESIKNLAIADFSLKNKTPFIQLIDAPLVPLGKTVESKIKAVILGGLLGGFLGFVFLIGRKIIRDALKD
jgi:hypothetical protein